VPHDRYYHPGPLTQNVSLTGDEHHHLFKVMRGSIGTEIELIDGAGTLAVAKVTAIDRQAAQLEIIQVDHHLPTPQRTLSMGLIKQAKLELVCEKCTELGITDFHFFPADHSERDSISDNHLTRLHTILISATKQCGRLYFPTIHLHSKIHIPESSAYATLEDKPSHLKDMHMKSVMIGPEKGWSKKEEALLKLHATPVTLHTNILRAETAAIVAAAWLL